MTMKLEVNSYGESYALKHALLVYESPGNQASYATKHPVQTIDGKPMIRPGAPADRERLQGADRGPQAQGSANN